MALKYMKNVSTLSYDPAKCAGCGRCTEVCPHGVFKTGNETARITDKDLCMECGACSMNCPAGAIKVKSGTGCATAMIYSLITGREPKCCGAGENGKCC